VKKIIYTLLIFIVTIALISLLGLDIKTASLFFNKNGGWIYSRFFLWSFMYEYGPILPISIGVVALLILIASFIIKKFSPARNKALFLLLVILIAPGFVAQTLKVTWGRPRPCEITNYGGRAEYRAPFEPNFKLSGNTSVGNSFPSGHAAIGFYTVALYFVFRKRWILATAIMYGVLMGAARMAQGDHFLSDVVSSFFIVYICMELFEFLTKKQE
jgi:membrane-associated PAP2 superfamily phosphatase